MNKFEPFVHVIDTLEDGTELKVVHEGPVLRDVPLGSAYNLYESPYFKIVKVRAISYDPVSGEKKKCGTGYKYTSDQELEDFLTTVSELWDGIGRLEYVTLSSNLHPPTTTLSHNVEKWIVLATGTNATKEDCNAPNS